MNTESSPARLCARRGKTPRKTMKMLMRFRQLLAEDMPAIPYWNNISNCGEIQTGTGQNGKQPNYMTDTEIFPDATQEEVDECYCLLQELLAKLESKKKDQG